MLEAVVSICWCGPSVHIIMACLFVRLDERAEVKPSVSPQSLVPGEIVDRDWFNK